MPHRTETQIQAEITHYNLLKQVYANDPAQLRRCEAALGELRRELRSLDDTPVVPYRPASTPPSAPRGRPQPPPIPDAAKRRK